MIALPEWMRQAPPDAIVALPPSRPSVVRRALHGFARLLQAMLEHDITARQAGLLQGIDARAKIIGLLALIIVATLVERPITLALGIGLCLGLAWASRLSARQILRAWLAIPLFSALVVLPATVNLITPGTALLTLWQHPHIAVTDAGLLVAGRLVLRTALCIMLALLLTATTRTHRLFRGLRALGVPTIFVMLLGMMERYLAVLVRVSEEIHLAKLSRSIVAGTARQERTWVAAGMAALFQRTQSLGQAVYLAMLSRGYTGEVYLLDDARWTVRDGLFLLGALLGGALLILIG